MDSTSINLAPGVTGTDMHEVRVVGRGGQGVVTAEPHTEDNGDLIFVNVDLVSEETLALEP